jgi:UDP-N-acetylglucosamine diphosphorylase / glucose-1-phosphate thymidylyltransferase / UDP-N-acetylgalactosamine diphosphorylase / glucosamine-1-phosphate N-acetyltransferase / galactosamine-1-phosphate N-acetyltransferase
LIIRESLMDVEFKDFFGSSSEALKNYLNSCEMPWDMLEKLEAFLRTLPLGQIHGHIDPRADVRDFETLYLGHGAEIGPGALIEGLVFLGDNVKVRHGAYIRGPCFIDQGSIIGHATEVKHAIFFEGASAAHFNYVGNSILGSRVQLGAGATCANLRFDKKPIIVRTRTKRLPTTHKKLGALIGQEAKLGCQVVLSPGCIVEALAEVPPLTLSQGFYERMR